MGRIPAQIFWFQPLPVEADGGQPLYIGQMICFCAERFHWRRIWQIPGELLLPGLSDMATRALLYRRPAEPSTLVVRHGSQFFRVKLRRHRRARRYTLRIHPTDREAILTMPPRGTIAEAKEFAQLHGGWIAARLGRLPKAAPFHPAPWCRCAALPHRIVHRAGERGTVWTRDRATAARGFSASPAASNTSTAACTISSSAKRARICTRRRRPMPKTLGVRVKRVSIRDQSSRWGSCTSAGSLSFSWRLILAPPYVLDYLAAHEVAHLVEMNHSARFWRVVGQVCGHVERAKTWLDTHGNDLHRYGIQD